MFHLVENTRVKGKKPRVAALLGMAGFVYVVWGFLNRTYFKLHWPELYLDHFLLGPLSEGLAILVFGLYVIPIERDPYTRRRLMALWVFIATMWGAIPALFPFREPFVGNVPFLPWFPAVHYPGAASYFVWLGLIFLFGRRVDCAWCCPCVGMRETVGAPFRQATLRGELPWKFRHLQWFVIGLHLIYLVLIFCPRSSLSSHFFYWFWTLVSLGYFLSFLLVPFTGNRNFCRYLCPFGSVYGLVGAAGFFEVAGKPERCVQCGKCDRDCDMGVPVSTLLRERGRIKVPECSGCGRCASGCPQKALTLRDFRDTVRGWLSRAP
jgi:ferredoxin